MVTSAEFIFKDSSSAIARARKSSVVIRSKIYVLHSNGHGRLC